MNTNYKELLASYMEAYYPIIYINHFDFNVIDEMIQQISDGRFISEFSNGIGMVNPKTKTRIQKMSLVQYLDTVKDDGYDNPSIIVLKDVHNQLEEPDVVSYLKYISQRNLFNESYSCTVFIVSSRLIIPKELENFITVFDIPLPELKDIENIVKAFVKDVDIKVADDVVGELSLAFKGLNEFQIKQILNLAYQDGGTLSIRNKKLILGQKEQLIKKSGQLEMVQVKETIDDIGGLENLKEWLMRKAKIFNQLDKAMKYGVDEPKGILVVGMPGCGKSLTAKATARLFDIPLVRLDVGRLLGKYVGESEENMRNALALSEAISPCVLWIDEIEKAFSGVGGDSGGGEVTTRLFGQFLTWMQEKESTVFIVATANDTSKIPPEFLRKGRFDELFFIDLPNESERSKIFEIHLRKRHKWNKSIDLSKLVIETEGYCGADIEAIIKDAVENCFIDGKNVVTTEDLLNSKKSINSISETFSKRIEQLKESINDMNLKPASKKSGDEASEIKTDEKIKSVSSFNVLLKNKINFMGEIK